jgi:hypothetical protein
MTEPPPLIPIHVAIPRIIGDLPAIGKDSKITEGPARYAYRGIEDIMPHVRQLFARHGVHITPMFETLKDEALTINGKPWNRVVLQGTFRFGANDGSFLVARTIGEARDNSDKAYNKAMTAAYKYAITQVLAIGGDDPDAYHPGEADAAPRPVAMPGEPFPEGAVMPEGGPWALNRHGVLVYQHTPNFEALAALKEQLAAAGVADLVREWAEREGVTLVRGHDEPGVARVVEYAAGLLGATETHEAVDPVADMHAQLADKGIELPADAVDVAEHVAEAVAEAAEAAR